MRWLDETPDVDEVEIDWHALEEQFAPTACMHCGHEGHTHKACPNVPLEAGLR